MCTDYRPDHNGECLNCDEGPEAHAHAPMCGRCYDEGVPLFPANCEAVTTDFGVGMHHCRDCGALVLAGLPHPPLCQVCLDRRHPGFDGFEGEPA